MSGNDFRLFAAIPLPGGLRQDLARWSKENRQDLPFQKWTHPDDYHITLFFIGDTEETRLPEIKQALISASGKQGSFKLRLGSIGTFGPPASPSILWSGVEGDQDSLYSLQKNVSQSLAGIGFPVEERAYKPHITLARRYNGAAPWNNSRNRETISFPLSGQEWTSTEFILYRSHLGRTPMYEAVVEFPLSAQ